METKRKVTNKEAEDLCESTFKLSNNPNLGKQLKNLKENEVSNKPNLEELFALSQHTKSNYEPAEKKEPAETQNEQEKNDLVSNFDKILSRALNPYFSQTGTETVTTESKATQRNRKNRRKLKPESKYSGEIIESFSREN